MKHSDPSGRPAHACFVFPESEANMKRQSSVLLHVPETLSLRFVGSLKVLFLFGSSPKKKKLYHLPLYSLSFSFFHFNCFHLFLDLFLILLDLMWDTLSCLIFITVYANTTTSACLLICSLIFFLLFWLRIFLYALKLWIPTFVSNVPLKPQLNWGTALSRAAPPPPPNPTMFLNHLSFGLVWKLLCLKLFLQF